MNFYIFHHNSKFFKNIHYILKNSLIDLGYKETDYESSNLVIAIRFIPENIKKDPKKVYILYQVEQTKDNSVLESFYTTIKFDKIWGFDISNNKEEYVPLGYHRFLELSKRIVTKTNFNKISLLGTATERRNEILAKIKNKWTYLKEFNQIKKVELFRKSTINLNVHSYREGEFTEWDRLSIFLANKCFFISEKMHLPLERSVIFDLLNYDKTIELYLDD